jgi:hypothetical protein
MGERDSNIYVNKIIIEAFIFSSTMPWRRGLPRGIVSVWDHIGREIETGYIYMLVIYKKERNILINKKV